MGQMDCGDEHVRIGAAGLYSSSVSKGKEMILKEKNERVQNLLVISLQISRSMDFWKYRH